MISWLSWPLATVIACAIASAYAIFWPRPKSSGHALRRPRWAHVVLRWTHSLVWWLLALVFFLNTGTVQIDPWIVGAIAWGALACYIAFMATLFYDRVKFAEK